MWKKETNIVPTKQIVMNPKLNTRANTVNVMRKTKKTRTQSGNREEEPDEFQLKSTEEQEKTEVKVKACHVNVRPKKAMQANVSSSNGLNLSDITSLKQL